MRGLWMWTWAAKSWWIAEREVIGSSYAEVGAFLLGLWGVLENVVEAVFEHHSLAR